MLGHALKPTPTPTIAGLRQAPITVVAGALRRAWTRLAVFGADERRALGEAVGLHGAVDELLVRDTVHAGALGGGPHHVFRAPGLVYDPPAQGFALRRSRPPVEPFAEAFRMGRGPVPFGAGTVDRPRFRRTIAGLLVAAACLAGAPARAQIDIWQSTSSGAWGTAGNWNNGVPTSASTATFNNASGLQTAITLNLASTAGSLSFVSTGGSNAYTFDTTPNTNTLTLSTGIANADMGTITFNNTTTLAGSQTWSNNGGTMVFNGKVNFGSGANSYALTVGGSGAVNIIGVIANGGTAAGSLEYSGSGTLTLAAVNTYTGATTIDSGANLQLGNGAANGSVNNSGITDNGTLTLNELSTTAISSAISGSGGVTKIGGTASLTGNNSYTGATLVSAGTLTAGSANALGNLSAVTISSGATLNLATGVATTVGSITGPGNITFSNSANSLTTGGNNASTAYSGIISGAGTLTEAGTGTLTLTGANTYSGKTTINNGATLQLGDGTTNGMIAGTITDNGTLVLDENSAVSISKVISGTGGVTMEGSTTTTLASANTYSGATVVSSGTLAAGNASAFGGATGLSAVTINDSGVLNLENFNVTVGSIASGSTTSSIVLGSGTLTTGGKNTPTTFSGVISGTGGLTEAGTSTLTLNNASTYSGKTTINAGANLQLGDGTTNGTISKTSGITDNGTLTFSEGSANTVSTVISGTGAVTQAGPGTVTLSGANTYSGATNFNGGTLSVGADNNLGTAPATATANRLNFSGGTLATTGTFTLSSNRGMTLNSGGGTLSPSSGTTLTYGGIVAGSGPLTVAGAGTVVLSGTNTYSGATNLNAGTLSIRADANLGSPSATAVSNSINFNGGTLATTASFTLNANRGMTVNSGGGTINAATGTTLTYGGLIAGTGNLNLTGPGIVDLTNNNLSFGGSGTVTSGELEFSGTLPSIGSLTLGTGTELLVNGSDLSVTNLEISGNAIIDFGSGTSILNATNFTIDTGAMLTVMGWNNEVDYFYATNWTGAILGTRGVGPETQVTFSGYPSSSTGWLSYDNEISPAPEPATYGAILGAICLLGVVVYRRSHPAA